MGGGGDSRGWQRGGHDANTHNPSINSTKLNETATDEQRNTMPQTNTLLQPVKLLTKSVTHTNDTFTYFRHTCANNSKMRGKCPCQTRNNSNRDLTHSEHRTCVTWWIRDWPDGGWRYRWTPSRKAGGIARVSVIFSLSIEDERADAGRNGRTRLTRTDSLPRTTTGKKQLSLSSWPWAELATFPSWSLLCWEC